MPNKKYYLLFRKTYHLLLIIDKDIELIEKSFKFELSRDHLKLLYHRYTII